MAKARKVTANQRIDAYEWIKKNASNEKFRHCGAAAVAEAIRKDLGFLISTFTVIEIAKKCGAFDFYTARVNYTRREDTGFTEMERQEIKAILNDLLIEVLSMPASPIFQKVVSRIRVANGNGKSDGLFQASPF